MPPEVSALLPMPEAGEGAVGEVAVGDGDIFAGAGRGAAPSSMPRPDLEADANHVAALMVQPSMCTPLQESTSMPSL